MQKPEFTFDHPCGLRISRNLCESDVASLDGVSRRDMRTGYVWYSMPGVAVGSHKVTMSLCFRSGLLDSVSIAVGDADLGSSWSDWTEEKERTRAKRTEDWLAAQGYATGTYSWGDVWAGYDAKGGSGSAGIRYNSEQAAAPNRSAAPSLNSESPVRGSEG
jgi:hypothetical protein